MVTATRRSREETEALYRKAQALVEGGKPVDAAAEEMDVARSAFHRWRQKNGLSRGRPGGRNSGAVDLSSIPPRPAKRGKGGYRPRKPVDLNDIGSVALRLSRIDKKLREVKPLMQERKTLAAALTKLLKGDGE